MTKLMTPQPVLTAECSRCHGAGSYLTDDINFAEGERLVVQVCTLCHNEAGLPLVQLPTVKVILPTSGQIASIARLIVELEELGDTEINALVAANIGRYDFQLAAKCIAKLGLRKAQRIADKRAAAAPATTTVVPTGRYQDVPAGRYAVTSRTGNNDLDFFHVTKGSDKGRWAGYTFIAQIAGDNEYSVRGAQARQALQSIVDAGINEAGARYGQEVGACFNCHIRLTRKYSRGMGYGPDCADNLGLPFDHAEYARSAKLEEEVAA